MLRYEASWTSQKSHLHADLKYAFGSSKTSYILANNGPSARTWWLIAEQNRAFIPGAGVVADIPTEDPCYTGHKNVNADADADDW